MVGDAGFEPATSRTRSVRATAALIPALGPLLPLLLSETEYNEHTQALFAPDTLLSEGSA